eukprot:TRINITY_DN2906_c0_g1::TRINITY_DN2906_c0_g1_i3::g.3932::m.3932 TRINITY_DN2906_c0_g1::TRINITY_DN2906_c0_g1_i3::g.3932  ORF type:complete len:221 (-),score=2.41 TRINITY_DN2906_c0_g1_i3:151-813(-)
MLDPKLVKPMQKGSLCTMTRSEARRLFTPAEKKYVQRLMFEPLTVLHQPWSTHPRGKALSRTLSRVWRTTSPDRLEVVLRYAEDYACTRCSDAQKSAEKRNIHLEQMRKRRKHNSHLEAPTEVPNTPGSHDNVHEHSLSVNTKESPMRDGHELETTSKKDGIKSILSHKSAIKKTEKAKLFMVQAALKSGLVQPRESEEDYENKEDYFECMTPVVSWVSS